MIVCLFLVSSRTDFSDLGPLGTTVLLLALTGFTLYMAYRGYGFWRGSQSLESPLEATATISKLYRASGYFAEVSFVDQRGNQVTTTIGVMQRIWYSLREGGTLSISHSAANPKQARFGGQGAQSVYAVSGLGMMTIGTSLSVLFLWLLIAGWAGWIDFSPFGDKHKGLLRSEPVKVILPKSGDAPAEPPPPPAH